jgi:hypothetical protein
MTMDKKGFTNMVSILDRFEVDETKQRRISREWQDYAYRLAVALDDTAHTAIYMRIAKNTPKELIEKAKSFVLDANARSKGKMFMWKLKQLKDEEKLKAIEEKDNQTT